jgi:hypothetical protein
MAYRNLTPSEAEPGVFVGIGRRNVYRVEQRRDGRWQAWPRLDKAVPFTEPTLEAIDARLAD